MIQGASRLADSQSHRCRQLGFRGGIDFLADHPRSFAKRQRAAAGKAHQPQRNHGLAVEKETERKSAPGEGSS